MRILTAALIAGVATSGLAAPANDFVQRKAGLWEIKTSNTMMGGMTITLHQCTDASTDLMVQRQGEQMSDQNCAKHDISRSGNRVTIKSVCTADGTTVTSVGSFTGDFETAYAGQIESRFEPPMQGLGSMTISMEGRWLGACKPGQEPGNVEMPGMGGFNLGEMMKNLPNSPPGR
jgi:hypothetical protein